MSDTDAILTLIDGALADTSSPDAMRWIPEPGRVEVGLTLAEARECWARTGLTLERASAHIMEATSVSDTESTAPERGARGPSSWPEDAERDNSPHAVVSRVGRWLYRIHISHGLLAYGPGGGGWYRYGRGRAERKARRELRCYLACEVRESQSVKVWPKT